MNLILKKFWMWIADFIANHHTIRDAIIMQAMKRPYFHLGGYMMRWWLIPESRWFPIAIRLHHILREDRDPYLHDHPWNWRTLVIKGWYCEEDAYGDIHYRQAGSTIARQASEIHRIIAVSEGGVWTIFIMKRKRQSWGFIVNNSDGFPRKIHYKKYLSLNGRIS